MLGKFMFALLLSLAAAHPALATCTIVGLGDMFFIPTKALNNAAAPVGTVIYEEAWTRTVTLSCGGTNNMLSTRPIRNGPMRDAGGNVGFGTLEFESDVEFSGTLSSGTGNNDGIFIFFEFPRGITVSTMTARLRYKKTTSAALGAGSAFPDAPAPRGSSAFNFAFVWNNANADGAILAGLLHLGAGIKSYASTCNLTVPPAVTLRAVPQRLFTGIGTVPAERTDFNMSADCSGIVAGQVVGVSFSESSRDASGSPGVIATIQGDGKAAGVGLQIINTTSGRPIAFNALERGTPPPALNGIYNFPMRVQYFQTAATVTAGRVTGTTVVTMQYR
jgi:type 1 fimbria pilin